MSTESSTSLSSVSLEVETTLSYSLPTHVGQGELFDAFWRRVPTSLESQMYRVTRIGEMRWRVGSLRHWSATTRDTLGDDRLAALRLMTSTMNDDNCSSSSSSVSSSTVVSDVKLHLASSRCVRYEAAMCLRSNITYPMLLEDRMSLEIRPNDALNGALLSSENDCSDNNMGFLFSHRLSFYAIVRFSSSSRGVVTDNGNNVDDASSSSAANDMCDHCCCCCSGLQIERVELLCDDDDDDDSPLHAPLNEQEEYVRVSLRSSLNEYHEIAYSLELECEKTVAISSSSSSSSSSSQWYENDGARFRRHDALSAVFVRYVEPWLCDYWPDGLRHETIHPTPPREILEDYRGSMCLALTGASLYSYDRLWQHVAHHAIESTNAPRSKKNRRSVVVVVDENAAAATCATTIKIKYDGVRDYGFFASNRLNAIYGGEITRTHSVALQDEHNRSLLSGLFVYQLETLDSTGPNESTALHMAAAAYGNESKESQQQQRPIVHHPRRRRYVITEVAFMLDHRALLDTYGGDVLSRPIEHNESVGTREQRCVATGYMLNERGDDLWRASMTALFSIIDEKEANCHLGRRHASRGESLILRCACLASHFVEFLACSARWPTSYVANDVNNVTTTGSSTAHNFATSVVRRGAQLFTRSSSFVCSMVAQAVRSHRIYFRTGGYDVCAMLFELYGRVMATNYNVDTTATLQPMSAIVILREMLALLTEHGIVNSGCRGSNSSNSNNIKNSFAPLDDKPPIFTTTTTTGSGNGLERVLVALGIEYSNAVLTRMHIEWRVDDNRENVLFVSEPYTSVHGEERVCWAKNALRRACEQNLPTDGFLETIAAITSTIHGDGSDHCDDIKIARDVEMTSAISICCYKKIKLQQSVELLVSWDRGLLACRDHVYALRQNVTADNRGQSCAVIAATTTTFWRIVAKTVHALNDIERTTRCRFKRRRRLIVQNLPPIFSTVSTQMHNHNDDSCHRGGCGSIIGEFVHIAPGIVRFLRWRSDKNDPDSTVKAHRVIFNDYD